MDTEPRPGPAAPKGRKRRKLLSILWWALVAAVVGVIFWLGTPQPLVEIQTPSMVPTLGIGDVALVRNLRGHVPEVGDVVSVPVPVKVQKENGYPSAVLHRVVEVKDGRLTTKGDNLGQNDPFDVAVSDVNLGLVTNIPGTGGALRFLRSPFGLLWIAFGLLVLFGPRVFRAVAESAWRDAVLPASPSSPAGAAPIDPEATGELAAAIRQQSEVLAELTRAVRGAARPGLPMSGMTVAQVLALPKDLRDEQVADLPCRDKAPASPAGVPLRLSSYLRERDEQAEYEGV